MDQMNRTTLSYFIIQGISDVRELQFPIFFLVLLIYLITLGSNITILLLVCQDPRLHTPMYFFLGNLSILDMSSCTISLNKVLAMSVTGNKNISFSSCMTQMYIFLSLISNQLLLLTAMSYDRYMAICRPLHYTSVMNSKACFLLALACWLTGFIELIPHIVLLLRFSCYKSNVIKHFFCDLAPIMKLSCSDTSALEILIFTEGLFLLSVTPFLLTFIYVFIIVTIMRIRSSSGRRKTFYTCSSHLTVVLLLYGTLFCQYLRPTSMDILNSNKIFCLFNTVAVLVLNPIIYSLKNEAVKSALKLRIGLCFKSQTQSTTRKS